MLSSLPSMEAETISAIVLGLVKTGPIRRAETDESVTVSPKLTLYVSVVVDLGW